MPAMGVAAPAAGGAAPAEAEAVEEKTSFDVILSGEALTHAHIGLRAASTLHWHVVAVHVVPQIA